MGARDGKPHYVDSIYFIGGVGKDFMATIYKEDGGNWELEWRFRYHHSPDPWDTKDQKSWYAMTTPDDSPESLARCREAIHKVLRPTLEREFQSTLAIVEMQCRNDDPKFFFELGSQPWANIKTGPEAEKQLAKYTKA